MLVIFGRRSKEVPVGQLVLPCTKCGVCGYRTKPSGSLRNQLATWHQSGTVPPGIQQKPSPDALATK